MLGKSRSHFRAARHYQSLLRELGLTAETVFTDPRIKVWRSIPERENCTLNTVLPDGRDIRLHIKRFHPARGFASPADREVYGIRSLMVERIPTAPLVGWGKLPDGRSFLITEDLTGYRPADKLLESGMSFDMIRDPIACLAARLHHANLHHRDLYLCHFFVKADGAQVQVALIDAGRVRRLPGWPFRKRWIVKDLAQLWYSTLALGISDEQRRALFARYAIERHLPAFEPFRPAVERKVKWIVRHDARLRARQPRRNISLPAEPN